MRIVDPTLEVALVEGHPGDRRLVVTYGVEIAAPDPVIGTAVHEEAVVRARDEHDAPVLPAPIELRLERHDLTAAAGVTPRRLERRVHRIDLDVEQDWWDTDQAGGTTPIAEFADHLVATVTLRAGGVVASAETAVVTGSWGALGAD